MLRQRGWLIGLAALLVMALASGAVAQRGAPLRPTAQAQALPPSGHQTEPVDLNEGKSPAELFNAGCAVCHQSAVGLAKGLRERELTNFLRQHYTSSVQHAGALANFLVARGGPAAAPSRPTASPSRPTVVERPPASIGRRPPDDDRKPQEAARPPEREPASRRKPPAAATARTPPPAPPAPAAAASAEPAVEAATDASTPASSAPVEEKPAAPQIPL